METISPILNDPWLLLAWWPVRILLVLILAVVLNLGQRTLSVRLARRAQDNQRVWATSLLSALPKPLSLAIWTCAIAIAVEICDTHLGWAVTTLTATLAGLVLIVALTWFALRSIRNVKTNMLGRAQARGEALDTTTVDAVAKAAIVVIILSAVVFALQNLGYSVSGLLAIGGLGALAIGLAAQSFLSNFFGGWMIYLTRPFSVGDWVRSPDREIEGTVERIGWMQTSIRAFDKRPLYVPNSIFNSVVLENPSRMTHRLINEVIGVRHTDLKSLGGIVKDVETYLRANDGLDQDQSMLVYFDQLTPNALNFFIFVYTTSTVWTEYQRVKQDVLFKVAEIIEKHGAEIGQPAATVHLTGNAVETLNGPRERREPG